MATMQNQVPQLKTALGLFSACDLEQVYDRTDHGSHLEWDKEGHGHMFHLLGTVGSCQLSLIILNPCSTFITGMLANITNQGHKVTEILSLP